jgi:hypothetical protein
LTAAKDKARAVDIQAVHNLWAEYRANPIDRSAAPGDAHDIETRSEK